MSVIVNIMDMKEIKNSIVSSVSKYLYNLQYLAKRSPKTVQDLMMLIICDEVYTWADWYQVSQRDQLKLRKVRESIINNNPEIIDDVTITNEFYKNVNTPQTIYTWERIYDDPLVQTFDTKFELIPDVAILRNICNTNLQSSQLSTLFDDTKNPLLDWWDNDNQFGALFGGNPLLPEVAANYNTILPAILDPNRCYMLFIWEDSLTVINVTGLTELLNLDVSSNATLTTIEGLSTLVNLQTLDGSWNSFTSIDITGLDLLKDIEFKWNLLTSDSIATLLNQCTNLNSGGYLDISGIYNGQDAAYSTWSSQAIVDYNTLISNGWTILYNS